LPRSPARKANTSRLRAECLPIVNSLDIPVPFHLQQFCDRLQKRRERLLYLRPVTLPPGGPSGMCVSTHTADYIFYEAGTSSLHREHIVLHEIGHLLLGHLTTMSESEQALQLLLTSLDPQVVIRMLGRGDCSGIAEQQAEMVATLIMQRAVRRLPSPARAEDAHMITRLSRTLEVPQEPHG
jgi:hypothetical protein